MSADKEMTIFFCNIQGVILNHFVFPKTNVTGNYYANKIKSELYQYPLHHVTYAPIKFEVAMSACLEGDLLTRKHIT